MSFDKTWSFPGKGQYESLLFSKKNTKKTNLVMVTPPGPFPGNRHLNLLLQNGLKLSNETYMRNPLLHYHRNRLSPSIPTLIHGILQHLNRNAIPSDPFTTGPDFLFKREVAVKLQIQSMVLTDFRMLCLVYNLSAYMQLRALRVEIQILNADLECQMNPTRGRGARFLGGSNTANGAGAEHISWSNQIVCVPL